MLPAQGVGCVRAMGAQAPGKMNEEQMRPLRLLARAEERGGLMAAAAPHRERRGSADLCSV